MNENIAPTNTLASNRLALRKPRSVGLRDRSKGFDTTKNSKQQRRRVLGNISNGQTPFTDSRPEKERMASNTMKSSFTIPKDAFGIEPPEYIAKAPVLQPYQPILFDQEELAEMNRPYIRTGGFGLDELDEPLMKNMFSEPVPKPVYDPDRDLEEASDRFTGGRRNYFHPDELLSDDMGVLEIA